MDHKVGMLRDHSFVEEQKADGEQTGAGGDEHENKNHDVTQVLHLGAGAEFLGWRCQDREPRQAKDAKSEDIPGDNRLSGGLNTAAQDEPDDRGDQERYGNAMPGILPGDPVHALGHRFEVIAYRVNRARGGPFFSCSCS